MVLVLVVLVLGFAGVAASTVGPHQALSADPGQRRPVPAPPYRGLHLEKVSVAPTLVSKNVLFGRA